MAASPPDDAYVSRLRSLSASEKNWRLIKAAKKGTVEELEALLVAGADVAARGAYGWTALHWAAGNRGHVEATRLLLAWGAPVNARNCGQWTPLHWATMAGHAAVVRLLLAASADVSIMDTIGGMTPLHLTAFKGNTEIATALLEAGADRTARKYNGKTPLDLARTLKCQELVELLTRM